jgi:hypothetical protein
MAARPDDPPDHPRPWPRPGSPATEDPAVHQVEGQEPGQELPVGRGSGHRLTARPAHRRPQVARPAGEPPPPPPPPPPSPWQTPAEEAARGVVQEEVAARRQVGAAADAAVQGGAEAQGRDQRPGLGQGGGLYDVGRPRPGGGPGRPDLVEHFRRRLLAGGAKDDLGQERRAAEPHQVPAQGLARPGELEIAQVWRSRLSRK